MNALNPADKDDQNKVEAAVEELQKFKADPPTTDKKIEDAIEDVLNIIRDLDGVEADVQKVSDLRDTIDKVMMIYARQFAK